MLGEVNWQALGVLAVVVIGVCTGIAGIVKWAVRRKRRADDKSTQAQASAEDERREAEAALDA